MPARVPLSASNSSTLSASAVRKWGVALNWSAFALPRLGRRKRPNVAKMPRLSNELFGRLFRHVRSVFIGCAAIDPAQTSERAPPTGATAAAGAPDAAATTAIAAAAPAPSASELINEGLRE